MPAFRYVGIPEPLAEEARAKRRSPQYGHPAFQDRAKGYGPCRACLRTFAIGEEDRLLFTYQPHSGTDVLPQPGPVFIHAAPCARYEGEAFPPDFRALPIVVEGYRAAGWLVAQESVASEPAEAVVARMFERPDVDHVHLRNREAGCFMARVERAPEPKA
jgi:hypothetical protein